MRNNNGSVSLVQQRPTLRTEVLAVMERCMKEMRVPALQALAVKAYLMRQSESDLREMCETIVMVADRLRPLMAEKVESQIMSGEKNGG